VLPPEEIPAHRVAPAHVTPLVAERIVLVEQMPLPIVEHHAVGVVHPVPLGSEVEAWTERLPLRLSECDGEAEDERKSQGAQLHQKCRKGSGQRCIERHRDSPGRVRSVARRPNRSAGHPPISDPTTVP
jgi:hypothetical protein